MKIRMNFKLAHAAGMDEANRQMRKAGRTAWNEDDYNLAAETLNRLYPIEQELADRYGSTESHSLPLA